MSRCRDVFCSHGVGGGVNVAGDRAAGQGREENLPRAGLYIQALHIWLNKLKTW